tara:strand:+ start:192 stop:1073 length:882 start_codon:yes stop_codon:yes gene_type:complete
MTPWKFLTTEYTHWALENRAANTVASQSSAINRWIEDYLPKKSMDLRDITPEMVAKYINADDGTSLGQRRFRLSAISSFLSLAKERGRMAGNPAAKLRVNMKKLTLKQKEAKKKIPFTHEEFEQLTDGRIVGRCSPRYEEFFQFATVLSYWTGLRLSDCASLEWDSIISIPEHLVVWTAKAGDKKHARVALPMNHELLGGGVLVELFNSCEMKDSDYLFPEERKLINTPATRSYLPQYYIRMLRRLGIRDKSFHCLRHSFVTRLANAGMELKDIGKMVAHTSTGTTEIYNHND